MASTITAGNATNGLALSSDSTGILNIKTGTGSGTNAITIDASQAVTIPQTLAVTGAQTIGGNLTVTGTVSATGGVTGSITSGTAQASTSGTTITFTGLPSTVKRITVMLSGVSTNGTSYPLIQIGTSGGVQATGYLAGSGQETSRAAFTTGFGITSSAAANLLYGTMVITLLTGNTWVASHSLTFNQAGTYYAVGGGGNVTLSGALDRVRVTTVNGTDAFDAGTINILYE